MARSTPLIDEWLKLNRNDWMVRPENIRDMWLDYSEMQEIDENLIEENDEFGYDKCIIRGVLNFNKKPPRLWVTPVVFPSEALLLDLSFCEVLKVAERYYANNILTASTGGTRTSINDRYGPIGQIRRELEVQNDEAIRQWKIYYNNEGGWSHFDDLGARVQDGLP